MHDKDGKQPSNSRVLLEASFPFQECLWGHMHISYPLYQLYKAKWGRSNCYPKNEVDAISRFNRK